MNKFYFKIAGINIQAESDNVDIFQGYRPFMTTFFKKADLSLSFIPCSAINLPTGRLLLEDEFKWVISEDKNLLSIYACNKKSSDILYMLRVNKTWDNATLYYLKKHTRIENFFPGPLDEILFRNRLLFSQGLVLHASAIKWESKGIVFSGSSGTGKSTMANLWQDTLGATVLNNDRPALRIIDDKAYTFGTLWSGSESLCVNDSAPLEAIVILKQASVNELIRLSERESIPLLMPRCFLPYYDSDMMDKAITNLEMLIRRTPVYLLKCKPDREAVELVHQCIK